VLECVINVSEGSDPGRLRTVTDSAGRDLLDVHSDPDHNRSVLTVVGIAAPREVTRAAVATLDIRSHAGVHPRLGVVDVVPFVALTGSTFDDAVAARDAFARWAADELDVPCFLYGPERTLPDVRRTAFSGLVPDTGPSVPHPTAGAICVGARRPLVAYNLWLHDAPLSTAKRIAASIRTDAVRALGLQVGHHVQVSINLLEPEITGPMEVYDLVASQAEIARAELVGLIGARALSRIPAERWQQLDLSDDRTIESRLALRNR